MRKLLLVDDETITLNILQKAIRWNEIGINQIFTATNAAMAREVFSTTDIDLMISDIEMPQESGLELIQWVQDMYPSVISIILTGHPDFNYARSAISLGVFEFLLKPVAFEELERTVVRALATVDSASEKTIHVAVEDSEKQASVAETVRLYLEDNYNNVITRNDIEKLVHLNQDHINRIFKGATGYTLMEYLQRYRIDQAKRFLKTSDKSILEISLEVGYDSPAYFAKIFKKHVGLTPGQYQTCPLE